MRERRRKRYVLIQAEAKLGQESLEKLMRMLQQKHGKVDLILVDSLRTTVIAKTERKTAEQIREALAAARFGGVRVGTVLTSGCIGKLKRRARETSATRVGEVLQ